ncbi:hypothetical protein [Clostridium cibarium]|uniref:EamA domain-containing protein n=1 Tax=Clostridium cibarium TaxID=2762247 RepID=A0ABR8PPX7_9CLOT|nr:hypothetical protein [Clostridium cibarium]MBD7910222.1 hypothetical protein [Clostridium cibarium]
MGNYIIVAIYLTLSVAGMVLFKLGCQKDFLLNVSTGVFSMKISLLSIVGLLCYIGSFLLYMFLLTIFDMSYIYPITTGIVQVLTAVFAVFVFNEVFTVHKVIGTIFILIGVVLISIKK